MSEPQNTMTETGRPRVLDETKLSEICALLHAGMPLARIARYVGCSVKTIRRERERNPDFDERFRKARMAAQLSPLQAVREAAAENWRAGAWYLERLYPEVFARPAVRRNVSKKELRALASKLQRIVSREVSHPLIMMRIESQMKRVIADATDGGKVPGVSQKRLEEVMQYLQRQDPKMSSGEKALRWLEDGITLLE